MAKYYGKIGYADMTEVKPGVWEQQIVEREYYGDTMRNSRRLVSTSNLNDDINVSMQISIVADPYANENFHTMQYVEYMGNKWKITDVEVQFPRLILTVGGVYNGQQT